MTRPPFSLRRALFAVLIASTIFIVGEAGMGFAVAADEAGDASSPPPSVFGVAAPRIGDAIAYEIQTEWLDREGTRHSGQSWPGHASSWIGQRRLLDGDGIPRTAHLLRHAGMAESEEADWIDPHRRVVLGGERTRTEESSGEGQFLVLPAPNTRRVTWDDLYFIKPGQTNPLDCSLYNALQGTNIETALLVPILRDCNIGSYDGLRSNPPGFRANRTERLGDLDTVVFVLRDAPLPSHENPLNGAIYNVTVWMTATNPYPLRIQVDRDSSGFRNSEFHSLVGYATGAGAALDFTPAQGDPAPRIESAPTRPWGIDDEGISHPFRLSEAYRLAKDAPDFDGLRRFLAAHPAAFTQSAAFAEFRIDQHVTMRWTIAVTDGASAFEFCAHRDFGVGGAVVPSSLPTVPNVLVRETFSECSWRREVVPLSARPDRLPTASSLLARAASHLADVGSTAVPNAYGLWIVATDDHSVVQVDAGSVLYVGTNYPADEVPHLSRDQEWNITTITTTPSGFVHHVTDTVQSDTTRTELPTPAPGASGTPEPNMTTLQSGEAVAWRAPPAVVMGSIGLVAVSAGLAYAFWPAMKAGLAGLFTRVQQPRALDHPHRRRIETLVGAEPGLHGLEVARRLGLPRGTVDHHLRQLVRVGLLTTTESAGFTCYFVRGAVARRTMDSAPVLKGEGAKSVLAAVLGEPGAPLAAVAKTTGLTGATVHYHVERLRAAGLLETRRDGVRVLHYATEAARRGSTVSPRSAP